MTRSRDIERARAAHYQEPAPSSQEPDDGPDYAALGIEPRYLPSQEELDALAATDAAVRADLAARSPAELDRLAALCRKRKGEPYHRAPTCGRVAPISERTIREHLADTPELGLDQALATPEGRAVLQDDPCEPGGDPFWHELFGGAPRLDGAL